MADARDLKYPPLYAKFPYFPMIRAILASRNSVFLHRIPRILLQRVAKQDGVTFGFIL